MRLLWVKAGKILPVDTGGRIRSFNILRHLAARNDAIFLSLLPGREGRSVRARARRALSGAVAFAAGARR